MFRDDLLAGKRVLVTGGGSGLGLAMSKRFAALGARVAITGRSEERLRGAAAEIDASGERVFTHPCDVRDFAQVEAMVAAVTAEWGGIDVLVNNAAGNFLAPTEDLSPNGFNAVVGTVLYGTFHATLAGTMDQSADIRRYVDMYRNGRLQLDELITARYQLDDINTGVEDLRAGKNIRGVVVFDG